MSAGDGAGVLAVRLTPAGRIAEVLVDVPGRAHGVGTFAEVLDPGSRDKAAALLGEVARSGVVTDVELLASAVDAAPTEMLRCVAWADGDHVVVVGTVATPEGQQVTEELLRMNNELAAAQRELARRNVALERAGREKNRLLGAVAHDLRNPLGVVTGLVQTVASGRVGEVDAGAREMLERVAAISQHMTAMVADLVDLAAVESGLVRLDLQDVDVADLLEDAVALVRFTAEDKDIALAVAAPAGATVRIDPGKGRQVVENLVDNAVKYSHRGTTVTVDGRVDGDDLVIRVTDEGLGIPQDEVASLFEPFSTTSVVATGGERSTGLGLAIVQRLVEAHNGSVAVDSEPGTGSTFEVRLPLAGPTARRGRG